MFMCVHINIYIVPPKVCLAAPAMRFIAYSSQFTDVTHVVSAMGNTYIYIYIYIEREREN